MSGMPEPPPADATPRIVTEELRQLVKNTGIYGLGNVLTKAMGFLMFPLYAYHLAPGDYGLLELLDLILVLAGIFTAMGIQAAVFRSYAAAQSETEKRDLMGTALLFYGFTSLLVALLLFACAAPLSNLAFGTSQHAPLLRIVSATFFFACLPEVPMAYWRVQEKARIYVAVTLGRTLLSAVLIALALVVGKRGVEGVLLAMLLGNLLTGTCMFAVVLRQVSRKISLSHLRQMLAFGLPLVPWSLNLFLVSFSDRFFLRYFASLSDVGIYALGCKLAFALPLLVTTPFELVWGPRRHEIAKREDAPKVFARIEAYLLLAMVTVGLAVAIMGSELVRIISPPAYWAAASIVPIIVLCYVFNGMRGMFLTGVYVQQATRYLVLIAAVVTTTNLVLNYVLISRYLAMGAAWATLITYAVDLGLCYMVAQRVYPVPYKGFRNAVLLLWAGMIYGVSTLFHLSLPATLAVDLVLVLVFLAGSVFLFDRQERLMFRNLGAGLAQNLRWVSQRAG